MLALVMSGPAVSLHGGTSDSRGTEEVTWSAPASPQAAEETDGDALQTMAPDAPAWLDSESWKNRHPGNVQEIFDTLAPGLEIPPLPAPGTPLADALSQWLVYRGLPVEEQALHAAVEATGWPATTQHALAVVILTHLQAEELSREALAPLAPHEQALLALDQDAVDAWHRDHDGDLEDELAVLVGRIDMAKQLQAAALLATVVESVGPDLALPAARVPTLGPVGHEDPWLQLRGLVQQAGVPAGAPLEPVELGLGLPPPIAAALEGLVSAQAASDAEAILDAIEIAHPILLVWQALREWQSIDAEPAVPMSHDEAWRFLADRAGLPPEPGKDVLAAWPAPIGTPVQDLLAALASHEAAAVEASRSMTVDERLAVADDVEWLWQAQTWSAADAQRLQAHLDARTAWETAMAPARLHLEQTVGQARQALSTVDLQLLTAPASGPLPGPGLAAASSHIECPPIGHDCSRDIWISALGGSVLVLGPHSTTVDEATAGPRPMLVIDLGGDDTYTTGVATALGTEASLLLDLGGDDTYVSDLPLAQGAAVGPGAWAMLWDVAGDDTYTQHQPSGQVSGELVDLDDTEAGDQGLGVVFPFTGTGAQGFGAALGHGILVDGGGTDAYDAPFSPAHGVGMAGGTGFLLDLGAGNGAELMRAQEGQGWASGISRGILVQASGDTAYLTLLGNETYQGGATSRGGIGFLLDGAGHDTYSNPQSPGTLRTTRGNERAWADDTRPVAGGLDLGASDSDGDGFHDLIENLAGTDPDDRDSHPIGHPALLPPGSTPWTADGPLVTVGDPTGNASEPALLIVGDIGPDVHEREALVMVDLGGDDIYRIPVGTPANLLIELGGDDLYDTPDLDGTQGAAHGPGVGFLIDYAGNDTYRAGAGSQGSSCCGADLNQLVGGIGVLADFGGDDVYEAGPRSQGYAGNMPIRDPIAAPQAHDDAGFAGILFDAGGDDDYTFATQGFAEQRRLLDAVQPAGVGGARLLGAFVDLGGDDTYRGTVVHDPSLLPFDADDTENFLLTQGFARAQDALYVSTPVGMFLDGGGNDRYLLATANGGVLDVTHAKQDTARFEPPTVRTTVPISIFADQDGVPALEDDDGDGAIGLIESMAGTDPDDPDDHPGSIARGDPGNGTYLVRAPGLLGSPGLRLPGLAIAGPDDDIHDETFDLFIDLGGNDTYLGPGHGGAVVASADTADLRPFQVRFAIDVAGDDTYRPAPLREERALASDVQLYRTAPSLGGAHAGVSVMADLGGTNTFEADAEIVARRAEGNFGGADTTARAKLWGTSQGAGAFGGIGMLLTWDGSNSFSSQVHADAIDTHLPANPEALAASMSQGAGWLGMGVLANFGNGADTYQAHASARAPTSTRGDVGIPVAAAQGAGVAGIGLLLDAGGDNAFEASEGLAQGAGWGRTMRDGIIGDAPFAFTVEDAAPQFDPGVGIGLLFSGPGNDRYDAAGPAQAAAGAARAPHHEWSTGYDHVLQSPSGLPNLDGGAGLGGLIDAGGDDTYRLTGPGTWLLREIGGDAPTIGQGAALPSSIAFLVDVDGDDTYDAAGALAQGAALGGTAMLVDLAGHDAYRAGEMAQGYASAYPSVHVEDRVCWVQAYLCSLSVVVPSFGLQVQPGNQVVVDAQPRLGAVALLLDVEGMDRYELDRRGQGMAEDTLDYLAYFGYCRNPDDLDAVPGNTVGLHPALKNKDLAGCPEGGLAGTDANPDFIESEAMGPPARGPLLGALVDGGGTDHYVYTEDLKVAADGSGPNDWTWRQEVVDQTREQGVGLPSNPLRGPLDQPNLTLVWNATGDQTNETDLVGGVYPDNPSSPLPDAPRFGGGVDRATIAMALEALAVAAEPVDVQLKVYRDAARTEPIEPGQTLSGEVHVFVDVEQPAQVQRVTVVANGASIGTATHVGGTTYHVAWATHAGGLEPLFPDGSTSLVAAARVGVERGFLVESAPQTFDIDNPPVLALAIDRERVSGRDALPAPQPAAITVGLGRDASFPPGIDPAGEPGAFLEMLVRNASGETVVTPEAYHSAGTGIQFLFDGRCGAAACPDGTYDVVVRARDTGGAVTQAAATIEVDSAPPESEVLLPPYSGSQYASGTSGLKVPWLSVDAGTTRTDLLLLGDTVIPVATQRPDDVRQAIYGPVATGQTLRFITVSHDDLGNSDSPCQPGESAPCYLAKAAADPDAIVETLVDFIPPKVHEVSTDRSHLHPVQDVTFTALAEEGPGESGILDARIDISGGGGSAAMTIDGTQGTATRLVYHDWDPMGLDANETPYTYAITVRDLAGNSNTRHGSLLLDALEPRVNPLETRYAQSTKGGTLDPATELGLGRQGAFAQVSVAIEDASLHAGLADAKVMVDADSLQAGQQVKLHYDPAAAAWTGLVLIPQVSDGTYDLPVHAVDAAGNENSTQTVRIEVQGRPVDMTGLRVLDVTHEAIHIAWNTSGPATSRALFGTTPSMDRSTAMGIHSATEHDVWITGLAPTTAYHVAAQSRSLSGSLNETSSLVVETRSAIELDLEGIEPGMVVGGPLAMRVHYGLVNEPDDPQARLALLAAPADRDTSPVLLHDLRMGPGDKVVAFDTAVLADGAWRIVVDATRPGDHASLESAVFRIDNGAPFLLPAAPAPGAAVGSARPPLEVTVGDIGGVDDAWASRLTLRIDGAVVPADVEPVETTGPAGTLRFRITPLEDLEEGERTVNVTARDEAGNEGHVQWPIRIDLTGPSVEEDLRFRTVQGWPSIQPGMTTRIVASPADASGLQSVRIALPEGWGDWLALTSQDGVWSADHDVPAEAEQAVHLLALVAVDGVGNEAEFPQAVTLAIDATPPTIQAQAHGDKTVLRIEASADEPVTWNAWGGGASASAPRGEQQVLNLTGLLPGTSYELTIEATDDAGWTRHLVLSAATAPDEQDPGPPGDVRGQADPVRVRLSWTPADDDSGIAHYEWRRGDGAWQLAQTSVSGDRVETVLEVRMLRQETFEVRAVDLAGNAGPSASAIVASGSGPVLVDATFDHDIASAHEPVPFHVTYIHPTGQRPDSVRLHIGHDVVPMSLDPDQDDCTQGCRYSAMVRLQPDSLLGGTRMFWIEAVAEGAVTSTEAQRLPLVLDAEASHDRSIPTWGPVGALAVALLRRRDT